MRWRNHRVKKESYSSGSLQSTTYYVRDIAEQVLAIYSNTTLVEQPIYGSGRLGMYRRADNSTTYQLTDHLGNVRVVFTKKGFSGIPQLEGYTDYYPGGMAMPGRNLQDANQYRYGYQGQYAETDPETGKPAFELRLYDPRINRWLTTDPYGQYHSPYMSMGNNPILRVDPDGGMDCPDPPCQNGNSITEGFTLAEVTVTGTAKTSINVLDIANFFGGLNENFNQGIQNRIEDTANFIQNDLTSADYWGPTIYNSGIDFANANIAASQAGMDVFSFSTLSTINTVSNMSANELAYAAGYNSPEIALMIGTYGSSNISLLPRLSFGTSSSSVASTTASYMFRHGQRRLVLRASIGQFARGTGSVLTDRQYFQLNGLNGLGQATRTTPLLDSRLSRVPGWARWTIGGGTAGAVFYDRVIRR
ncbi:hypothetical protein L0P88_08810 [Muricauda sp. SCSIO 64092]|uniref:RHS repeat-associated core domain-containing protein n=1 Tax=Allomuricauda sp. SCSIO 64092 TaxID=2908842 RepID=UPI001FF24D73|nr:RHS repeat-associated core domain-containing protein [Muricauda sp. SCSIO 64092]UOY08639.1 hypothetical protein L0P88_08810 [Muricauda sp. SCSIO 64092]